mgnify:CR=1 FL=1
MVDRFRLLMPISIRIMLGEQWILMTRKMIYHSTLDYALSHDGG